MMNKYNRINPIHPALVSKYTMMINESIHPALVSKYTMMINKSIHPALVSKYTMMINKSLESSYHKRCKIRRA